MPAYTSASTRVRPPVASLTLGAPTTRVAPLAGTWPRLATFSSPHRPDGSHSLWVLNSFDGPLSSDNVSTAMPATLRSLIIHSAASGSKPGK